MYEGASNSMLENEFGTTKDDEIVAKILEKGTLQEFEVRFFYFPFLKSHNYFMRPIAKRRCEPRTLLGSNTSPVGPNR